ncbi:MAG: AAA family ATPase [Thermodesulfovibrio sp.]|nr:AAA family ATPase [Thermodesulfovibrio sp.]
MTLDYLQFYKLREDPFGITPDPDFFYPSRWHMEALQSMEYLIRKGEGFMLLTGSPGTGKTTLIRTFLKNFGKEISPIVIYQSTLSPNEFLKFLAFLICKEKLENLERKETDKITIIKVLTDEFIQRRQLGIKNLIIIDESQDLPEETLIEIKHLSNIETEKEKLLHFILLAQPYFEEMLLKPAFAQLNQRISLKVSLESFDKEEVENYIKFRLQRIGEVPINFDKGAIKLIHKASKGIPRLINLICSRALMIGYMESSYTIKKSYVKTAIKHLKIE